MVYVVRPLGVEAKAAFIGRAHEPGVVLVALRDELHLAAQLPSQLVDLIGQLLEERERPEIVDALHRVKAQRVDVEFRNPVERVVVRPAAHVVAARAVVIHRAAPRRAIDIGEVGTEAVEVVAFRAHVIVDDVEHDAESVRVGRVHEVLEAIGAAVRVLRRVVVYAVVAPVATTGKRCDGHELDSRDAECDEVGQSRRGGFECAFVGKGADVHFIYDEVRHGYAAPCLVSPEEQRGVHDFGQAVYAVRLRAAYRVGQRVRVVDAVAVAVARTRLGDGGGPDAALGIGLRERVIACGVASCEVHGNRRRGGCPDAELHRVRVRGGAPVELPRAAIRVDVAVTRHVHAGRITHAPTGAMSPSRAGLPGGRSWNQKKPRPLMVS